MKAVITYASAGAGHFKAAEAIHHYLQLEHPEVETSLVDILQQESRLFQLTYKSGYSFLIKYLPSLWGLAFWLCGFRPLRPLTRGIARLVNRANSRKFSAYLIQEDPDLVISTHFLTSEIAVELKKTKRIHSRVVTVVTDFGVHPFWLSPGTDLYVVASEFTKSVLVKEMVEEERIRVLGIPVDQKFLQTYDRPALREKFGLQPDKFTVLVATGSFGIGPIEEIVQLLHEEAQILVVTARNTRLYAKLQKRNYPHTRVFGFVDNIHELMAVSQLIITKPGGLTISESLAMELVPVFIAPIPGQEMENIKILAKLGIGAYPKHLGEIKTIVREFNQQPDKLLRLKEIIRRVKRPNAAKDLWKEIGN